MKKTAVRKAALILALCLLLPVTGCTQSNQGKYESAQKLLGEGKYDQAIEAFSQIEDYENSSKYIMYIKAIQLAEKGEYELGIASLQTLGDFKDSTLMARYYTARAYEDEMDYESAADIYKTMATFRDCGERYAAIPAKIQERTYNEALALEEEQDYESAADIYQSMPDYKDCAERYAAIPAKIQERTYNQALALEEKQDYEAAADIYQSMPDYKDCAERYAAIPAKIQERTYNQALALEEKQDYEAAADIYQSMLDYKDCAERYAENLDRILGPDYDKALALEAAQDYEAAADIYRNMLDYKDCAERYAAIPAKIQERIYNSAMELMHKSKYTEARKLLLDLQDYSDVETQLKECDYQLAIIDENNGNLINAYIAFSKLNGYKDADEKVKRYEDGKIKLVSKAKGLTGEFPVIVFINRTAQIIEVGLGDSSTDMDAGFLNMVKTNANYLNQFVGKTAPVDEASIDVVAGATVSSKAVVAAVNAACENLPKAEPAAEEAAGTVLTAQGKGLTGEFPVNVTVDANNAIVKVELGDSSTDMDAIFLRLVKNNVNYLNQFIGKTVPVDEASIDVVAGATVTSKAVIAAVNTACER